MVDALNLKTLTLIFFQIHFLYMIDENGMFIAQFFFDIWKDGADMIGYVKSIHVNIIA